MSSRVMIVGASSGLGRCIGVGLAKRGARVALLARRRDQVEAAAAEAGGDAVAVCCDATDGGSVAAAVAETVEALGGIDSVIYTAAIGPLAMLRDADADAWHRTFATNVVGASLVTAAALPHLASSEGRAIYLSTTGASFTPHWNGLGVYQVTKAALERLVEAWRAEHPEIGFSRVILGECAGGEGDAMTHFNDDWDRVLAGEVAGSWFSQKLLSGSLMDVEHLVEVFDALVRSGPSLQIPSITVIPRPSLPHGV